MRSLLILLALLGIVFAHTAAEWKSRVIYQILTDRFAKSSDTTQGCGNLGNYCGGTWKGIQNHLDYVKTLGANAIWISPIPLNIAGAYHGYALKDLYQVNPNFGTEADLISLVKAAHSKDIWVMLDVVANHVGNTGEDFGQISPFNQSSHYHSRCQITNYQNQTEVEYCRLCDLPDLDQAVPFVRDTLVKWVGDTVRKYGFDGLRIDTIPEVSKQFWPLFRQGAGVYTMGEVFDGRVDYVASYQTVIDATLSYPMYFTLKNVFQGHGSMYNIRSTLQSYSQSFKDVSVLGGFTDNHDNPRFLHDQGDYMLYENALTYNLFCQSIPIVYYGSEQGFSGGSDPGCREPLWTTGFATTHTLFKFLQTALNFRSSVQLWNQGDQVERYIDDTFYAFTRGKVLVTLTNVGSNGGDVARVITYHPYAEGTKLCNIFWPTVDCITVTNGQLAVKLLHGESKVYHPVESWPKHFALPLSL